MSASINSVSTTSASAIGSMRFFNVCDVVIDEAAQHVSDRVHLANVRQKLVAEALALRCATHQTRDIDERQPRRNDGLALRDRSELVEALVRNADFADVGFDRAEGIVRSFGSRRLRQRIEEGRLADVRQADDTALEAHARNSLNDLALGYTESASGSRPHGSAPLKAPMRKEERPEISLRPLSR